MYAPTPSPHALQTGTILQGLIIALDMVSEGLDPRMPLDDDGHLGKGGVHTRS